MKYEGNVYRPPSEARSLIIQITIGCSHNKCTFCYMYKDENFRIRSYDEIINDLQNLHPYYENPERIFLADGDALFMDQEQLEKLLIYIGKRFPTCKRIGVYGSPVAILRKSVDELKRLKELGLGINYLGVESGSAEILRDIKKGVSRRRMIEAAKKIKEAGIKLSITVINGIGGKEKSNMHAIETATICNEIQPDYLGLLTLRIFPNTELCEQVERGEITLQTPRELLAETKLMVENFELNECVFRSNHASNYIPLSGVLNRDKKEILRQINESFDIIDEVSKHKIRSL